MAVPSKAKRTPVAASTRYGKAYYNLIVAKGRDFHEFAMICTFEMKEPFNVYKAHCPFQISSLQPQSETGRLLESPPIEGLHLIPRSVRTPDPPPATPQSLTPDASTFEMSICKLHIH
jgi:hypothetical protein